MGHLFALVAAALLALTMLHSRFVPKAAAQLRSCTSVCIDRCLVRNITSRCIDNCAANCQMKRARMKRAKMGKKRALKRGLPFSLDETEH